MGLPQTMSLRRPCPNCSGQLSRKTDDPKKPLGMVACSNCNFKVPIKVYVKSAQAAVIAKANQRRAQR